MIPTIAPYLLPEIIAALGDRFPELGQSYFDSGPKRGHEELCQYFKEAADCGALVIEDFDMAADQFAELCKSGLFVRAAFGVQSEFSDAEIERVAEEAAKTFIARYGA